MLYILYSTHCTQKCDHGTYGNEHTVGPLSLYIPQKYAIYCKSHYISNVSYLDVKGIHISGYMVPLQVATVPFLS